MEKSSLSSHSTNPRSDLSIERTSPNAAPHTLLRRSCRTPAIQEAPVMSHRAFVIALLAAGVTTAANADAIDPCSLLSDADMIELGLSKDSVPSRESQPGGVQACKYQVRSAVADRVAPCRSSCRRRCPSVPCNFARCKPRHVKKVRLPNGRNAVNISRTGDVQGGRRHSTGNQPMHRRFGAIRCRPEVSRQSVGDAVTYPASQLRIMATMVSRLTAKGG